jgi:hypothetical protein
MTFSAGVRLRSVAIRLRHQSIEKLFSPVACAKIPTQGRGGVSKAPSVVAKRRLPSSRSESDKRRSRGESATCRHADVH